MMEIQLIASDFVNIVRDWYEEICVQTWIMHWSFQCTPKTILKAQHKSLHKSKVIAEMLQ